jgi:hypothetical protein
MKTILLKTTITWGPFKSKVGEVQVQLEMSAMEKSLAFKGNVGLLGLQTQLHLKRSMDEFMAGKSLRVTLQKGATPLIELTQVEWKKENFATAHLKLRRDNNRIDSLAVEVHRSDRPENYQLHLAGENKPLRELNLHLSGLTLPALSVAKYQFS